MKQECPTYLKTIRKSKALSTTLSDTEPEDDFDNEDDGILNAFTIRISALKSYCIMLCTLLYMILCMT